MITWHCVTHDNMALRHTAELPSLKSSDLLLQTNKVANSS